MTEKEADLEIAKFLDRSPGWCIRARETQKLMTMAFCPVCGITPDDIESLCKAIKLKINK